MYRFPALRFVLTGAVFWALMSSAGVLQANVALPALFGDHMVLQRDQENRIWGWADPEEQVEVSIADQSAAATADENGRWSVTLGPLEVGGPYKLEIVGKNTIEFDDVLVGEVWVCSGQSNMQWPVAAANDPDLESLTAHYPQIRLITVPQYGIQTPQEDFEGQWELCTPESVVDFSAVGYFFGRQLHQTLGVPIGLIDNSWGGSSAEAWVRRDLFQSDPQYQQLLARWDEEESKPEAQEQTGQYEQAQAEWNEANIAAKKEGRQPPQRPAKPGGQLFGQHRPGNLYNGVLKPILGYGIRGVIWYQGESNASRAYQYRHLFPLMIQSWRDEWGQNGFPFYWVQLADFQDETPEPGDSAWAELREAQTMAMAKLSNTGQAVITDLGEAHDIHPKNKQDVAKRLARWALAQVYGFDLVHRSPEFASMRVEDNKAILDFSHAGGGLDTFDVRQPRGFAVAGENRQFVWADAKIVDEDTIEVSSESVENPVAVRYAWANNPIANVQNKEGLPLTPFRTDDWPGITANNER